MKKKKKASPRALRCKQRDQEEAVSVCACMIVFVRKRKGGREREEGKGRKNDCVCALMHNCEFVLMQLYLHSCGDVFTELCMCVCPLQSIIND